MRKPIALKKGETIGVIAPAGRVNPKELSAGVKQLEHLGFRVVMGKNVLRTHRYMAGRDQQRAEDLHWMFSQPEIRAIVCARGGYGCTRLLPLLDEALIRNQPKIFVGSSDVTALLLFLVQRVGLVSFHGPMVVPNFGLFHSDWTTDYFIRATGGMELIKTTGRMKIKTIRGGTAQGMLTGGCLSLLCALLGTPHEPETDGAILFLEDVNEAPYRIDRMLTQLKAAGKFRGVRGVIFGRMSHCEPKNREKYRIEDVISEVLDDFEGPILYGFPAGHSNEQITLPLGIPVEMDGKKGYIATMESAVTV